MAAKTKRANSRMAVPAAIRSTAGLDAVAEYFDWLNEEELMAEAAGNRQYADAMARASSELGCLLIKHNIYREMKATNGPSSATASAVGRLAERRLLKNPKRQRGKRGRMVRRFSDKQAELAAKISNDIAEEIDCGESRRTLRMAVAYFADVACVEAQRRALCCELEQSHARLLDALKSLSNDGKGNFQDWEDGQGRNIQSRLERPIKLAEHLCALAP